MAPQRSATDTANADRPAPNTTPATNHGERFARAIGAQDAAALKALLAPDVTFRALTPGRVWDNGDANSVVDDVILGTWFPPARSISSIISIDCDMVGAVAHVSYRFRATLAEGDFLVEQQAYLKMNDRGICWIHILCSGFVPDEQPPT